MNLMALRQVGYRHLLPQRLQRDLRLQRRVNLPSRLRHLPLRPVSFGADFFQPSQWSQNPGPLQTADQMDDLMDAEQLVQEGTLYRLPSKT
jgi:hypothetical protein